RNEVEAMLAGIMQEALGVDRVGINDNFFELGGDSVLSIQIIARVNRAGWRITPQQLFQHQTIAELATVTVKTDEPAAPPDATPPKGVPTGFGVAGLAGRKLNKLSRLLEEEDDFDDQEEDGSVAEPFTQVISVPGNGSGSIPTRKIDFSLFYFAADNSKSGADKYRLYLEGAKFADENNFE